MEVLRDNPLAEGDICEGDLLCAVLTRNSAVWSAHPELARQLTFIVGGSSHLSPDLRSEVEGLVGAVQNSVLAQLPCSGNPPSLSCVTED
ncbi:contact-dependent growth inhibition system immunity protein [Streptomyces sp. NPDC051664]|uniref:contact-dependent growth inhibition system immunity protein n=1 Tax=Streptomyces sp. NPDC051664 TaxID=3365668 RepID=UPI00378C19C2